MPDKIAFPSDLPFMEELETKSTEGLDRHDLTRRIEHDLGGTFVGHFRVTEQRYESLKDGDHRYSIRDRMMEPLSGTPKDLAKLETVYKEKLAAVALEEGGQAVVKHRREFSIASVQDDIRSAFRLTLFLHAQFKPRDAMVTERYSYQLPDNKGKIELDRILRYRPSPKHDMVNVSIPLFPEIEAREIHLIENIARALGLDLKKLSSASKRDLALGRVKIGG